MEDTTWSGDMIMPDTTYAVPSLIFDDADLNSVVISPLVGDDLSVTASIGEGEFSFILTNFDQINLNICL